MKFVLLLITALMLAANASMAAAPTSGVDIKICPQKFALCAASTCKPTGKKINVMGQEFDEVKCDCPVLDGPSVANVALMNGSCKDPGKGQVWSLYAPKSAYPQKQAGWAVAPAQFQTCKAGVPNTGFANCWSFPCNNVRQVKAVDGTTATIASCHCPANESPVNNGPVPPGTDYATQAGMGQAEPSCSEMPVGGPAGKKE